MGKLEDALKVYSRSLSTSEAGSRERKVCYVPDTNTRNVYPTSANHL